MAKQIKDTDYLVISARIRAMENDLLTRGQMEQLLEARTDEEIIRILQERGYPEMNIRDPAAMDAALSASRKALLEDLEEGVPDAGYMDVFRLKYDYHNIKAALKAAAMNTDAKRMLMDMGRVPAVEIQEAVETGEFDRMPAMLSEAAIEAKDVLDTTRDPQLSDMALDRWMFRDMLAVAEKTGSEFLLGYVRIQIDAVNLRVLVRTLRMGKNTDFLRTALLEGGEVDPAAILSAVSGGGSGFAELYASSRLRAAAEEGAQVLHGGMLTEFERLCDDAVSDYLSGGQMVPFGEAPLLAYLAARDVEYTNLRILLMGRRTGLPADVIRNRLRASFV